MPNHCLNEIVFRGLGEPMRERIVANVVNAGGDIDFNILVPAPLNMWWGNVGQAEEKAFRRTHLAWARENWGTKWNAYSCKPPAHAGDTLTLIFQTAWGPPYPWLAAIFNAFKIGFDHNWISEGGAPACEGRFVPADGDFWKLEWVENEASPENARRLHKMLWGVESFDEEQEQSHDR